MRHLLALFALVSFLAACDDSPTATATGVTYAMRGCSDSAHYGNSLRSFTLSDGQSISIAKGDSCTSFYLHDTIAFVSIISGDRPYSLIIKSGSRIYLNWQAGSSLRDTAFSDSLKYCKEYTNTPGVTNPCAKISPQGFPFQVAN